MVDGRGMGEWSAGCLVRSTCAGNKMEPGGATEVAGALRGTTTLTSLDLSGEQRLCCGVVVMWGEDMARGALNTLLEIVGCASGLSCIRALYLS